MSFSMLVLSMLLYLAQKGAPSRHTAPPHWLLCYKPRSLRKQIIGLKVLSTACMPAQQQSYNTPQVKHVPATLHHATNTMLLEKQLQRDMAHRIPPLLHESFCLWGYERSCSLHDACPCSISLAPVLIMPPCQHNALALMRVLQGGSSYREGLLWWWSTRPRF